MSTTHQSFGTRDPRDKGELDQAAVKAFAHLWNELTPTERARLVKRLEKKRSKR